MEAKRRNQINKLIMNNITRNGFIYYYCESLRDAWMVVEKLPSLGFDFAMEQYVERKTNVVKYRVDVREIERQENCCVHFGTNVSLLICLAALEAVGVNIKKFEKE